MINGKSGYCHKEALGAAQALEKYPLATLVGSREGSFTVSRIPLIVRRVDSDAFVLEGHVAKGNPQHQEWTGTARVAVIVDGDHAYISPSFYHRQPSVPTWNYYSAYLTGRVEIVAEPHERLASVCDMVRRIGGHGVAPDDEGTRAYYGSLIDHIVVFRVHVEDVCIKEKVSRHRSMDDQRRIAASIAGRNARGDADYLTMLKWLGCPGQADKS